MRSAESSDPTGRARHRNGARKERVKASLEEVLRVGRGVPRRLQRDMGSHPEAALATVGGVAFLAGMLLGSRVGRALLATAASLGLKHVLESELGPRIWSYIQGLLREAEETAG